MPIFKAPKPTSMLEQSVNLLLHFSSLFAVSLRAELRQLLHSEREVGKVQVI